MEKKAKTKNEHKNKEPDENPKNILDCKIACVAKGSRFIPSLKHTRVRATNVYPLELNEYKGQSYVKKITCPKCMSNMEITVRSEKAGSLYYKLIVLGFVFIFILTNIVAFQNIELSANLNTILEINAILLGSMIGLLILVLLNNYAKTRSKRSIRLKMKAQSSMAHKLYKSRRNEYKKIKNIPKV